jgi:DNA repair protein RadC
MVQVVKYGELTMCIKDCPFTARGQHFPFVICHGEKYLFNRAVSGDELVKAACFVLESEAKEYGTSLNNPEKATELVALQLSTQQREVFACLFLNNKHQLIKFEKMFFGSVKSACVVPREIAKQALLLNAAAIIIAHNHPSGSLSPSDTDRRITNKIREVLAVFDIRLLDHIIVGCGTGSFSFATEGLL